MMLLFIICPALVRAQLQQPTDEELKMTSDPKFPGVSAVYLNITEISNRDLGVESYYARIKVLAEKGKELATVKMPYRKHLYSVADIQARTIQPDGTVVPVIGKPADLLRSKTKGDQSGTKVFTLPNVQVGSIIEYYFQIRFSSDFFFIPYWEIQYPYPVRAAHYQCIQCGNFNIFSELPVGTAISRGHFGHITLDLQDVPPAPDEDWMPPLSDQLYRVAFHSALSQTPDAFWKSSGDSWSRSVDAFVAPSKSFRETVKELIAPGDSDMDKARKLYTAVQTLDNTDFSRQKSDEERKRLKIKDPEHAEDIWAQKSGTRTGIALLYLSMLRAADVPSYAIRVADRSQRMLVTQDLDWDQLDDTLVLVGPSGKEIVLDPGEKMCPFELVHWSHTMTGGVRQTATGSAIASTPAQVYTRNTTNRVAEVTVDSHDAIDATLRFGMVGQKALYWRQQALQNDEDEVKKQFDQSIADTVPDGVEAHVDHFIALDDPNQPLVAIVKAHGTIGVATSRRLLVPGLLLEARGAHPFIAHDKRITPIDMHYAELVTDDVTYSLPPGLSLESAPQTGEIIWQSHAVLAIKTKSDPGHVTITRTFARGFTFAPTTDYQALREFYQKIATADQQQVVLTHTPAISGN
jgi:hypothetical protein